MFVDTNVLVSAYIPAAPDHERAVDALWFAERSGERLTISGQIIREFLAVATRPQAWGRAIPMSRALTYVHRIMETFEILEESPQITETLLDICARYPVGGRQIHDANIVAVMRVHGERRLLTFNQADFRRYSDIIELAPDGV